MSSNQNGEKNDEQKTTKDEETECDEVGLDRIVDEEEREGQIHTEQNDEENGGWRRIPVTLTTIKVGGLFVEFISKGEKVLFCCIKVGCL